VAWGKLLIPVTLLAIPFEGARMSPVSHLTRLSTVAQACDHPGGFFEDAPLLPLSGVSAVVLPEPGKLRIQVSSFLIFLPTRNIPPTTIGAHRRSVELDPNGQFDSTEYGRVKGPAQIRGLRAYPPYHHVVVGEKYPAVFMETGNNDPRINPAHSSISI
jgi:hypothetical protein